MHTEFLWDDVREKTLVKPGLRWEYNIKMDLREVGRDAEAELILLKKLRAYVRAVNETPGSLKAN